MLICHGNGRTVSDLEVSTFERSDVLRFVSEVVALACAPSDF